jgi:hypothetical protein
MVELLASSSPSSTTVNNENEPILNARKLSHDVTTLSTPSEMPTIDSSRVQSKLLHRRIATMLETLTGRNGNSRATSPPASHKLTPSHMGSKSQPITFGQLRQSTASPPPPPPPPPAPTVVEEASSSKILSARSHNDLMSMNTSDRQSYHTNVTSLMTDVHSDLNPTTPINRSSPKHQANKERIFCSPLLEQSFEQHNVVPRMKEQDESEQEEEEEEEQQQPKPPLTVDEILATFYSKVKVPTTTETKPSSPPTSYPNNNMGFYVHPSSFGWNGPQTNQHHIPPPQLLLNEQNRNRPPPPSYSLSIASGNRPPPGMYNLFLHK